MKVTNLLKKNLKKIGHSQIFLYVLVIVAVLNLIGFLMQNNITALVIFLITGLGMTYITKNMIYVLLVTILLTNFIVGMKLLGKKNHMEGLKNKKRINRRHKKNLNSVEHFSEITDDDSESDEEEEVKPAIMTNAQKNSAKGRQNKIPAAVMDDDDDAAPLNKKSSMINQLNTKQKAMNNISKMLGSNNLNNMTKDANKILDHQDKLLEKLEKLEPLVMRAGSMLERFQGSKLGKMVGGQ